MIKLSVPGRPVPKSRPRTGQGRVYTPARTRDYERAVKEVAQLSCKHPLEGELWMSAHFYFRDNKAGDIDNYIKSIFDGMEGVCFHNDRQIKVLEASIRRTDRLERAEVEVGEI